MGVFGIGFIVVYLVGKMSTVTQDFVFGTGVRKPYMNILVAIFGGSQPNVPQRNFARCILMMFLMFCMVIRTLYTGSLYTFLQSNIHHKEAQSIDDMIERDYKFYTVSSILDLLQGQQRINQRLMSSVECPKKLGFLYSVRKLFLGWSCFLPHSVARFLIAYHRIRDSRAPYCDH